MSRVFLSIFVVSLLVTVAGCSDEPDIGKGYNFKSGDLGAFILNSAPKFRVRVLTTNGLSNIPAQWRYKETSDEFQLFVEGDYFPQLHTFLTKTVGSPTTNSSTELHSIEAYYGTNSGATVCCRRGKADNGKQYTSFVIVSYGQPDRNLVKYLQLIRDGVTNLPYDPMDSALDTARSSAPYLSDFLRLFPKAEVRYSNFDNSIGFDVEVDLYERYELVMQLPAVFDAPHRKVIGYGEPRFYLMEAVSVKRNKSGIAETSLNPAGDRKFGPAQWKRIVEADGNFAVIGYTMLTNQPVPGFKDRKTAFER
jgi:hypothetical protein